MVSLDIVNTIILVGALLVLLGIFSSLVATRFGAPLLLVFITVGMLAGEDGIGGLEFDDYHATYLIGSIALAVILFDGGLRTKLSVYRGALGPSLLLATLGVIFTAAVTAAAAYFLVDRLTVLECLLIGGIVGSTDAAAVFFLLRTGGLQLQRKVGSVLEIESSTNDPIAVFLAVVLTELLMAGAQVPGWDVLVNFGQQAAVGAAVGVAGGFAAVALLNRVDMPTGLHPLSVVAGAVLIYSAASLLGGSGLLAAYLAGLVMANRPVRAYPSIVGFHDAVTWLCQIGMFIVLGLLVTPSTLVDYAVPGVAIALVLIFVARPLAVWLCLWPFGFSHKDKLFVSWVGLRGAVSIFLATIPVMAGAANAQLFFNIAFFVVLMSLAIQSWTIRPLARRLGVALLRTAPKAHRLEVDVPGHVDQEIVGYPVLPDSLVLGLSRFPGWARTLLVVRDKEILDSSQAGPLQPGDYIYLLTSPERVPRLDRIFEASSDVRRRNEPVFGELPLKGDARMGDLAGLYDLELAEEDRTLTVAEFFGQRLSARVQQGARVPIGGAMLVVREAEDGKVLRAGLQLAGLVEALMASAFSARPRGAGAMRWPGPAVRLARAAARLWRRVRLRALRLTGTRGGEQA